MKLLRAVLLIFAIITSANFCRAQPDAFQVIIEGLESTTPSPGSNAPSIGNFFSAQFADNWPPLPGDIWNLPFWDLGEGVYVYDDRDVDYSSLGGGTGFSMTSRLSSSLSSYSSYGNAVYLTNLIATGSTNITATFSIAGGTNFVPYDILTTTNLMNPLSSWSWLGLGYTSNTYTFSNQPTNQAFYTLAKPFKTMTLAWGNDASNQCEVPSGISNAVMVTGGYGHSLALLNDGSVVAWGENDVGQGSVPTNISGVTMIASGWYHNVVLLTNGTVQAWGIHSPFDAADVPAGLTNITVISAQALHSLALASNGTVTAWGYGTLGETNVLSGLSNVTAIAAGYQFNVVALSNGTVTAWGNDSFGQTNIPAGLSNVVDVAAGPYHSLALLKDGTVMAWGDNSFGETNVPMGLTNVVAIAAGGNPTDNTAYSLALKKDGTLAAWGNGLVLNPLGGVSNVVAIGAGTDHALAIRTGPRTPVITLEPVDQFQLPGGSVTFAARGSGLYGVTYQWQFNGTNISDATNASLTITNVQSAELGNYDVIITDDTGMGSIISSNAALNSLLPPVIDSQFPLLTNQFLYFQNTLTLSVAIIDYGAQNGFPLSYQWQFNGTNIVGATSSNYTVVGASAPSGTYSIIVTNAAGSTNANWNVTIVFPGGVAAWGSDTAGESEPPTGFTNAAGIAAGELFTVALKDDGTVLAWGADDLGQCNVPTGLSNVLAVAAGDYHSLALLSDGTVTGWGLNSSGEIDVPAGVSNVVAIAAGGGQSMARLNNGTVTNWGDVYDNPIPVGLTNVSAIALGEDHSLALQSNGMVMAWGNNTYGQTNVPSGLSNVVAVAAGGQHSLALKTDGTVIAWGDNLYGQTNVPAGLSNVMAVAAGYSHSVALKNDGTVVSWGEDSDGQIDAPLLTLTKLIAAGGNHTVAAIFNPLAQYYPIDVSKDLLLIYNTNSTDSSTVLSYYLVNRPMVSNANVLGIGYTN